MNQFKVMEFLEQNKDFLFPNKNYSGSNLENALLSVPDEFEIALRGIPFRKPMLVQIISVVVGSLGVDRFYLEDKSKGILKFLTFGGFGIWWLMDIFSAKERCRAYNCKKLLEAINNPSVIAQMQNTDSKISQTIDTAKKFAPVAKELFKGAKDIGSTFNVDN